MTMRKTSGQAFIIGSLLALALPLSSTGASAQPRKPTTHRHVLAEDQFRSPGHHGTLHGGMKSKNRLASRRGGYGIQCVTFARVETGIQISGNAANWWENAAGVYQRGNRPELGSVLNFRANGRMHLGHVAVVTNVVDSRQIDIDQANWPGPGVYRGGVARDIRVVDVSPDNDWSAVRVALGHTTDFGSVYPTFGFIYDRADHGTVMTASAMPAAPLPALNPPPADLRAPQHARSNGAHMLAAGETVSYDEVAEAPAFTHKSRHARLRHRSMTGAP